MGITMTEEELAKAISKFLIETRTRNLTDVNSGRPKRAFRN